MKLLVTGVKGQLGYDVMRVCRERGIEALGVDVDEMDITDTAQIDKVLSESGANAVVHCAAYTAVDAAEDNIDLCRRVNAKGTENIAKACKKLGLKLMYFSTDYVFNGQGTEPWREDAPAQPLNVYGQTKYEGECAVRSLLEQFYILRISWVFGLNGGNFVKTMLRLGKERGAVSVVNDQVGSPTYTYDLAGLVVDMVQTDRYGTYHVTNEGLCSWYDFARAIFRAAGMHEVTVTPVDSAAFAAKAKRPANSRMVKENLTKAGFSLLPAWEDALKRYLAEL